MSDRSWISKAAGAAAVVSAGLFIASLKAPDPAAIALTVAWNLLLLPAAVMLWRWLRPDALRLVDLASGAGVAACVLWAAAPITGWWQLEAVWIGLGMVWWLGVGLTVRPRWKWFGWFSLILSAAALLDLVVTLAHQPGIDWAFIGALKLPLSILWSLWLGVLLIRRPVLIGERPLSAGAG